MAEINQLPIQESESHSDSDNRILSLLEDSRNISQFSTTLIANSPTPSSEVEFGYYAQLSEARDIKEFEAKISGAINALGFDEFSYCWSANNKPDTGRLINISPHLLKDYFAEQFFEQDLILPYANASTKPIYQSTLHDYAANAPFETKMTRMMRAINNLNRCHGYYDFYNSFAKAKNRNGNVMLSVTNRGCSTVRLKELVKGSESTLQVLCEAIDFVASQKFSEFLLGVSIENTANIAINPRPLKVLDALANNDFNISQVADHLCISTVTANKHLETARRAFGAKTNYYAIKQAVLNGLIDFRV
jgi:hypothetical protein